MTTIRPTFPRFPRRALAARLPLLAVIVGALLTPTAPRVVVAQELPTPAPAGDDAPLDEIVARDLATSSTGVVAGGVVGGELDFLDAWGTPSAGSTDSLDVTGLLAFPGLTDVLVAMTVRALDAGGLLDASAPLSRYLGEASGRLGRATLDQLLSHTAGLGNAPIAAGESWTDALDGLDDDSFVAEPGEVYSVSRYSYPLAAHVLETLVKRPFAEIAATAVLTPLGMTRSTFDVDSATARGLAQGYTDSESGRTPVEPVESYEGLPVLYTSAPDVLQLLSAWMTGGIRGSAPIDHAPPGVPRSDPSRHFSDGVVHDVASLLPQASVNYQALGFGASVHLYPEAETAYFIWTNGPVARNTLNRVGRLVAEAVGDLETSMATQGVRVTRSIDPDFQPDGLSDVGEWTGTYRNGPALLGLRFANDQLWFYNGRQDLPLRGIGPATFVFGDQGARLQLVRFDDRRIALYGDLAYAWQSADLPPSGGG